MKALIHLCLSSHPEQLERWRKAFPEGRIVTRLPDSLSGIDADVLLWLHTPLINHQPIDLYLNSIKKRMPNVRIILVSDTPSQTECLRAISVGVVGYCHAHATPALLQQVATVAINGGLWLGVELMDRLLAAAGRVFTPQSDHVALITLTQREKEVALAVASGKSNREIAVSLNVTERTIKAHLSTIFEKLSIRDRLQLVVLLRDLSNVRSE